MFRTLLLFFILLSGTAAANCTQLYQQQINKIDSKLNPPRTTLISSLVAEGVVVSTLAALGTLTPTAVIALPATAVGAGTYYALLLNQKNQLIKAMHLIRDSQRTYGKTLEKTLVHLSQKNPDLIKNEVISFINQNDQENNFCKIDTDSDKVNLFTYHHILKFLKKKLNYYEL